MSIVASIKVDQFHQWCVSPYQIAKYHYLRVIHDPDYSNVGPIRSLVGRVKHLELAICWSIPLINNLFYLAIYGFRNHLQNLNLSSQNAPPERIDPIPVNLPQKDTGSNVPLIDRPIETLNKQESIELLNSEILYSKKEFTIKIDYIINKRHDISPDDLIPVIKKMMDESKDDQTREKFTVQFMLAIAHHQDPLYFEPVVRKLCSTEIGNIVFISFFSRLIKTPQSGITDSTIEMILRCILPNTEKPNTIFNSINQKQYKYFFSLLEDDQFKTLLPMLQPKLSSMMLLGGQNPLLRFAKDMMTLYALTAEQLDILFHTVDLNFVQLMTIFSFFQNMGSFSIYHDLVFSDHLIDITQKQPEDAYRFICKALRYHPNKSKQLLGKYNAHHIGIDLDDDWFRALKQTKQPNNRLTIPFILQDISLREFLIQFAQGTLSIELMQEAIPFFKSSQIPFIRTKLTQELEDIPVLMLPLTDRIKRLRILKAYTSLLSKEDKALVNKLLRNLTKKDNENDDWIPAHAKVADFDTGVQGYIRYEEVKKVLDKAGLIDQHYEKHDFDITDAVNALLTDFQDRQRELIHYQGSEESEIETQQKRAIVEQNKAQYRAELATHLAKFLADRKIKKNSPDGLAKFIASFSKK